MVGLKRDSAKRSPSNTKVNEMDETVKKGREINCHTDSTLFHQLLSHKSLWVASEVVRGHLRRTCHGGAEKVPHALARRVTG